MQAFSGAFSTKDASVFIVEENRWCEGSLLPGVWFLFWF
jgi:hypothetical protein